MQKTNEREWKKKKSWELHALSCRVLGNFLYWFSSTLGEILHARGPMRLTARYPNPKWTNPNSYASLTVSGPDPCAGPGANYDDGRGMGGATWEGGKRRQCVMMIVMMMLLLLTVIAVWNCCRYTRSLQYIIIFVCSFSISIHIQLHPPQRPNKC